MRTGIYKHSKSGKEYRVIGIAKHSETLEEMVIYQPLYEGAIADFFVRPINMWDEEVEIGGEKVSRFQYLREE